MHWLEAEELAGWVLGLDPDEAKSRELEAGLQTKFGVDLDTFHKIAYALIPFTIAAPSALSDKTYQGFVYDKAFICKREVCQVPV